MSNSLSGVAPSLGDIISKSSRPAPAPPGSVAIAQVPWIGQNAGEALGDHKNVCHSVFHFPGNTEVAMDEVLHPFQVRQKLLASMNGWTSAVLLARRQQVLAAEIKHCLLLKGERRVSLGLHVEEVGQGVHSQGPERNSPPRGLFSGCLGCASGLCLRGGDSPSVDLELRQGMPVRPIAGARRK